MAGKLKKYQEKRDFDLTNEPKGKVEKDKQSLIFVVQHHLASRDHYDFRLEWRGILLSWAVPKGPSFNPNDRRLAAKVEDHPFDYKDFEGNIPKGQYGGGVVMLWDEGNYQPLVELDEGLKKGRIKFELFGQRLKGKWSLVKMNDNQKEKNHWLLIKDKDQYAKTTSGIAKFITSIRTNRKMAEIEAEQKQEKTKNPFQITDVQLATLSKNIPSSSNWIYELKYDGYRIVAYLENGKARLLTRNGNDYHDDFPPVVSALLKLAGDRAMILDGEMTVLNNGRTDFQSLQNYFKNPDGKELCYIIFDLLALDGQDLRSTPLIKRKKLLDQLFTNQYQHLHLSKYITDNGSESLTAICQAGLEGLICKKADSLYRGQRNGDWLKIKCDNRQELVIGGYTISAISQIGISSIIVGYFDNQDLIYAGRAGTGFTRESAKNLLEKFHKITRITCPFKEKPALKKGEKVVWLKPILAAEVKFAEWTQDNRLRQASFKGLRTDKDSKDIIQEKAESNEKKLKKKRTNKATKQQESIIKLTNPDKLLYDNPKITKIEVAQYYQKIAKRMLPYLNQRLLSLINCPKGVKEPCFFKKHPQSEQGVVAVSVKGNQKERKYFYIQNQDGIINQVQMNSLEFHVWGSRVDKLEQPDMMVFDLDPDSGMPLKKVRQGAIDLNQILKELGLKGYLKTSGGKGYHVVVPFKPVANWEKFSAFAKNVSLLMEQKWPNRYTANLSKEKRKGKIFIDWMRNTRGATSIAPYSIRARKGAKVSMPISWSELNKIRPDQIDINEAIKRSGGRDPWLGFHDTASRQQLKQ